MNDPYALVTIALLFLLAFLTGLFLSTQQRRWRLARNVAAAVAVLLIGAILFPIFAQEKNGRGVEACMSNVKQLSLALLVYSADHDDRLPLSLTWWDAGVVPYSPQSPEYRRCRFAKNKPGYAMNSLTTGMRASEVEFASKAVMIFESELPGPNASGTEPDMVFRHKGPGGFVAAVDSTARYIGTGSGGSNVRDFVWRPIFTQEVPAGSGSKSPQKPAPSSRP